MMAEPALELQRERDPLEGVDAEVELQTGLQVEGPVGIALPQHLPDLCRDGIAQERTVLRGECARLARRLAVARLPVALRQQAAAVLAEPRSEERRVGKERVRTCRSRWSPYT